MRPNRVLTTRTDADALSLVALFCYDDEVLLGGRPTVGQQTLDLLIGVRIPASQSINK
jgi:hypothetical protein